MMRRLAIGLASLTLVACSSGQSKDPNERSASELYVLKAVQYMESGRLDIAQQDLQKAIDLDSRNIEAHNALGVLDERINLLDKAEEEFRIALSLDENHTSAANNYGRLLCSRGKYEQGMKYIQSVIDSKLYQAPWLPLTNAGICAKNQGKTAEAEAYLRRALEADPNFGPALLEMAKLSLETNNYLSARAFLQRLEAISSMSAESLALGIQVEQALGNQKDADAYLRKLRRLYPDSKEAQRFLRR